MIAFEGPILSIRSKYMTYASPVQNTANIIGHSDIRSTMAYNRYALSKNEIQDLLDQINRNNI